MECICTSTANQWQVSPTCSGFPTSQYQIGVGTRVKYKLQDKEVPGGENSAGFKVAHMRQVSHGIEFKHSYVELVTLSAMLSLES